MDALHVAGWALSGGAASCWLIVKRANAQIRRSRAAAQQEISHWKTEAVRARIKAAQLRLEIDAWKAGHAQGRDDVINALPLLAASQQRVSHDPATCDCQPATQTGDGA